MKRPQRRRAPKGRRSTPPAPSVQELLGVSIGRREAYLAGHQGALFDELNASLNEAHGRNDRRRPEDLPLLPDGSRDARIHSDDNATVTMPLWAFDAVYDLAMEEMISGSKGMGKHAKWWRKYREDLGHWHRYALVEQALKDKRAKPIDVYEFVAGELVGTAFAVEASGIKYSVEEVVKPALARGEYALFYRSATARVYEFLRNTSDPPEQIRGSQTSGTYGHVFLKVKSPT